MLLSVVATTMNDIPEYADEVYLNITDVNFKKLKPEINYNIFIGNRKDLAPPVDKLPSNVIFSVQNIQSARELLEAGYPAFYLPWVRDWSMFYRLAEMGMLRIRICEPIVFDTETIKRFKVKYPNLKIIARANPHGVTHPYDWFVRPEDIHLYDGIIDILEVSNPAALKIYHDGQWLFNVSDYLPNSSLPEVSNPMLDEDFARKRLTCRQHCVQLIPCHHCSTSFDFSAVAERNFKNGF